MLDTKRGETLLSASNMVWSLWQCGQKTEGEQLLSNTLALPHAVRLTSLRRVYFVALLRTVHGASAHTMSDLVGELPSALWHSQ